MNLREETERIILEGYSEANAQSKLCQDIVLKAISESDMAKNASRSSRNWLDMSAEEVLEADLAFFRDLAE